MMLGSVVTLLACFWIILYQSYTYGGINLQNWFWRYSSEFPLTYLSQMLRSPSTTDLGGWFFTFFGAGCGLRCHCGGAVSRRGSTDIKHREPDNRRTCLCV